ncbi:hypothetical protein V7S43_010887 [Phytophthora oleae]|uniref:CCD97-like C-terminal domain-containing protein n=1 Tax=Phytophthora oleae TaxID=2107226 RepID=A0ABD3FER3_9STRA
MGRRLNMRMSSQQRAGEGPVSTRTRTAENVGKKRKAGPGAASSMSSTSPSRSAAEVPGVSLEDLQAARNAFYLKYMCMPKQSSMRRTLQEPLTNYQKRKLVDRYIAARKRNEDIDYKELSTKTAFDAFIGHPEELKKHGDNLLQEFYQLYEEDQAQLDLTEAITTSSVAAAAEVQSSTGKIAQEERSQSLNLRWQLLCKRSKWWRLC